MEKEKAESVKMELIDFIESGTTISTETAEELLELLEGMYPETELSKDTTPMIGTNPFKSSDSKTPTDRSSKDFNDVLNYRVQKFNEFEEGK